jgi:hypothetical protein
VRVRCASCGADYETEVSPSALLVVNRCDRCGLSSLRAVGDREGDHGVAGPGEDRFTRATEASPRRRRPR